MTRIAIVSISLFLLVARGFAEEPVDLQVISRIKSEGLTNSKVMETIGDLVDRHGGRLAGSSNFRAAAGWCRETFEHWGLENAHLEAWGQIGRSWELKRYHLEMLEPYYLNIIACPKAWTSGTDGVLTGTPILLEGTTPEDLSKYEGKLKGAIVLQGALPTLTTSFEPEAKRYTAEGLDGIYKTNLSAGGRPGGGPPRFGGGDGPGRRGGG